MFRCLEPRAASSTQPIANRHSPIGFSNPTADCPIPIVRANGARFPSIQGGFPHSEIHGSKLIRSSPRLIAAYHVLLRLCMPRHPPNALTSLDRSHCQCSSSGKAIANSHSPIDPKIDCRLPKSDCLTSLATFYNQTILMPSTCSIRSSSEGTPVHFEAGSSRPASRDQIRGCAVRQHPPDRSASKKLPPFSTQRSLTGMGHKGPSGSIFSSQWIKIRQNRVFHAACKLWSFSKKTEGQSPIGNRQSNIVPIRHPSGARPHANALSAAKRP